MVDIRNGSFNNYAALEGADYNAPATTPDAFRVFSVGQNNWFEAELTPSSTLTNISRTDHTQFRIYFAEDTVPNRYEGWYSGESGANSDAPQLIVRYKEE